MTPDPEPRSPLTGRAVPRTGALFAVDAVMDVLRDWLKRFFLVQGLDRAMALGAQAYTAMIPLLIVYATILPTAQNRGFADVLTRRFHLTGAAATGVHEAFAPPGTVQSSITVLGIFLLVISALSFTRGLQRLYELAYVLPTRGVKNTPFGVMWLVFVIALASVRPIVAGPLGPTLEAVVTLAFSGLLWLGTPYLLLGRRLDWRTLAPGAVLAALGMTGIGIWSAIWMPKAIASSAHSYGIIGVGFAILTWLVVVGVVLVLAATGGAMIAARLAARRATA